MTKDVGLAKVPINIMEHHVHLSKEHANMLFGQEYMQIGNRYSDCFSPADVVAVVGPKGILEGLRVIGPYREQTQVEITETDAEISRLNPPVRYSGELSGTPGTVLVGPKGVVTINEGVIIQAGHLHLNPEEAGKMHLASGDKVTVLIRGEEEFIKRDVLIRVAPNFKLKLNINSDEAQLHKIKNGDLAYIIPDDQSIEEACQKCAQDAVSVEIVTRASSYLALEGIRLCTNIFEFSTREKMRFTQNLLQVEKGELKDYFFIVAVIGDKVVGVTSAYYLPDLHMGYLEFIGVKYECRNLGLGTTLYKKTAEFLNEKYNDISGLILEVRNTRECLDKRKDFFLNHGAIPIDLDFYPIGHKLDPDLMLMFKPLKSEVILNTPTVVNIFSSLAKVLLR